MEGDHRTADTGQHQVVKFRPRTSSRPPPPTGREFDRTSRQPADDLGRFERDTDQKDDYRQRMLMNAAAIVFTVMLTAAGIWLAMKMADLKSAQDCVLMGRRDCAHISTPAN